MPIVAVAPSILHHSWLGMYLRSVGRADAGMSGSWSAGALVEGEGHDLGGLGLVLDRELDLRAGCGERFGNVGSGDVGVERGGDGSRADGADHLAAAVDLV